MISKQMLALIFYNAWWQKKYLCCLDVSSKSPILEFFDRFPKMQSPAGWKSKIFLSSMSYCWRNIYQLKLRGWDFSFRNECSFRISWYVFLIHIKWQILRNFYWVAPNYYHVFFIPLTPPFINFHHLSVLPVFKIARCKNLA